MAGTTLVTALLAIHSLVSGSGLAVDDSSLDDHLNRQFEHH